MKIRLDFITNSSSSSFIVCRKELPDRWKNFIKAKKATQIEPFDVFSAYTEATKEEDEDNPFGGSWTLNENISSSFLDDLSTYPVYYIELDDHHRGLTDHDFYYEGGWDLYLNNH